MREDDFIYLKRRAIEEQVAARNATCEAARRRHEELAAMYRFRAAMVSRPPTFWADALENAPGRVLPEAETQSARADPKREIGKVVEAEPQS